MKKSITVLLAILGMVMSLQAQIPTDGLVAHYSFDNTLNDAATGYNLTSSGTTYSVGEIDNAFLFTGSEECYTTDVNFRRVFDNTNAWSVNLWFNSSIVYDAPTGYGDPSKALLTCDGVNTTPYKRTWILVDMRGILFSRMLGSGNGGSIHAYHPFLPDTWYHVSVNFNGTGAEIYINGILTAHSLEGGDIGQDIGNVDANTTQVTIGGNRQNNVAQWKGNIDQVRVYNSTLTATEVKDIYEESGRILLTDIDGNAYNTVTIGNQVWMAGNLKTTKYNDGTAIPLVTDNAAWGGLSTPAYCWINNDEATYKEWYGALYNFYAVVESLNICPIGWHVPSDEEWKTLEIYLGMTQLQADSLGFRGTTEGGKMKETGTSHWTTPNTGATNGSGFSGIPNGHRYVDGSFYSLGINSHMWTSTGSTTAGWHRSLEYNTAKIYRHGSAPKTNGMSVRCIKNSDKSIAIINDTVNEGQQAIVPISVSDLTAIDNVIAYQFDIDFDNTVLEYTGSDLTGTLAAGGTAEVNTSIAGKLSISYMNSTALVGAGDLIKLQFNPLTVGTTEVFISNAYLNSTPISNLSNGTVIITDGTPPTGKITYDNTENRCGDDLLITATFNEPMLEENAVRINLTGGATLIDADMTRVSETVYTYLFTIPKSTGNVTVRLSNGTDLWGNEIIATPTSGNTFSIIPITNGDVDDDGIILAYDAALTLQYSVDLDPLPTIDPLPWENWREITANVDGIGAITANDAGMILQYSVGIITSFDASAKKSASAADVNIEVVDGEIVFYSSGNLIGINVSTVNENNLLGEPVIVAENFLSAKNIDGTTYKIGLCTSTPASEGDDLIKIPFNANGQVTFDMVVNTVEKSVTFDLATGLIEFGLKGINIYPNPATEILYVEGLQKETIGRIYNANGQMVQSSSIGIENDEISVSELPAGLYILKMSVDDEVVVKQFTKE